MVSRRIFLLSASSLVASGAHRVAAFGGETAAELVAPNPSRAFGLGRTFYVAPTGKDGDDPERGSVGRPFATLPYAFFRAAGGDTIVMRGGIYGFAGASSGWLLAGHDGAPGRPIVIENHPGEVPVIDGVSMRPPMEPYKAWPSPKSAGGFPLVIRDASHLILRGLTIRNGPMGGCQVNGTHHDLSIERCVFRDNGWLNDEYGTGLAILGTGDHNIVRNCDSFGNRGGGTGATGGNADGISISLYDSVGTIVTGNRAWRNTDDGFDFFNPSTVENSRNASPCLIDQNWAFENGCNADGSIDASEQANGCGFKLGGRRPGASGSHGGHTVTRCLAWNNKASGFDDNGDNGGLQPLTIFNNVSFNNARGDPGYAFIVQNNAGTVLRNNIAFVAGKTNDLQLGPALQSHNASNGTALSSLSPTNLTVALSDFESIDDTIARGPRQPDSALPFSGFLRLAKGSKLIGAGSSLGLPTTAPVNRGVVSLGAFEGP